MKDFWLKVHWKLIMLINFCKIGNAVLLLLGAVWYLISKDWYLITQTYITLRAWILDALRKKKKTKEKSASKKQVAVCNHNFIMKKISYNKMFLLIIKLISSPQTRTGTGITMIIMSCKNYSYLNS